MPRGLLHYFRDPSTIHAAEVAAEVIIARFSARQSEIQWRGLQRDATMVIALALCGGLLSQGVWALAAPVPLLLIASKWLQHDSRIGEAAHYLRTVLEPHMQKLDNVLGYEAFLDERRQKKRRFPSFTSAMARLFFPSLQTIMLGAGLVSFHIQHIHGREPTMALIVALATGILVTILTFAKVKHIRGR